MVASKFLNDDGEDDEVINSEWANSAKIELSDLNQIERQFLQAIVSWSFHMLKWFFAKLKNKQKCKLNVLLKNLFKCRNGVFL